MPGKPSAVEPGPEQRARLLQLAYTILSPSLGRTRRTLMARMAVEHAIAAGRNATGDAAGYSAVRARVVQRTLATGRRRGGPSNGRPRRRAGGATTAEPDLAWLLPAARAAYALRHLEGLAAEETHMLLAAAGVGDPDTATALADRIQLGPIA